MSAATYDRTIRQGNTEPFRINFRNSELPSDGKSVVFRTAAPFSTVTLTKTAETGAVGADDQGYDAEVDKWFAAWELSSAETRSLEPGAWPYEIEVWAGETQT